MSRVLLRSIATQYLLAVAVLLPTVVLFAVVVDFAGSTHFFRAGDWLEVVPVLFWNRALLATQQLAPAAVLLAGGLTASALRQRGELTALRALGFSPATLLVPVGLGALLFSGAFVAFDEYFVGAASQRVDAIMSGRLNRWGDVQSHFAPKQWFRSGPNFFHLRAGDAEAGFHQVTIFTLRPDFTLGRRLDAESMSSAGGTRWRLRGVAEQHVAELTSPLEHRAEAVYDLGVDPSAFRVRAGRPEQMRVPVLLEQIAVRAEVGLPTPPFVLALHNRFSYPLAGLPGALLGVLLALRGGRKGHLTTTLVEGTAVTMSMWGLTVVARTLVLSERLSPAWASWAPFCLFAGLIALLWLGQEGAWVRLPVPRRTRDRS